MIRDILDKTLIQIWEEESDSSHKIGNIAKNVSQVLLKYVNRENAAKIINEGFTLE